MERSPSTEPARDTVRTGPWLELYQALAARDPAGLDAAELEALAEAAWWLCRTGESIAARRNAAACRRATDDRGAARTAARLFHDHFYRGEHAVAVAGCAAASATWSGTGGVERGWLEFARAELHLHRDRWSGPPAMPQRRWRRPAPTATTTWPRSRCSSRGGPWSPPAVSRRAWPCWTRP